MDGKLPILLAVFLLTVAGCELGSDNGKTVRVGAVYPLSGPQSSAGAEVQQGIELALDIINRPHPQLDLPLAAQRGLPALGGTRVEVIYADHQSTAQLAREQTARLIEEERAVALLGAYESEQTRIASEVAEGFAIPFVNATSTSPALTERGFQWFFRTTPADTTFVNNALQFIRELNTERGAGLQRLAVIHEGSAFGTGVRDLVASRAPEYGMEVVASVETEGAATSVPAEVTQVREAQPDAVLFAVYAEEAIPFMQEFKAQDYAPPLIWADDAGFISPEFLQTLGADAEYVTSREVWSVDLTLTNPLAAEVNALYRERYGVDLGGNSARSFIGMMTLAEAINRAGSTEPTAVRDALRATDIPADQLIVPWQGIGFDQTGQNTLGDGVVVQRLNGRYRTVWPNAIAVEPLVFPLPDWGAR